jgi:hypothetical protein
MSEQIRHTLLNHEETPPPAAWGRILAELNESDSFKTLGQTLQQAEVIPASHNWDQLLIRLEDISISSKLQGASVNPPPGTWQKITEGLDSAGTIHEKNRTIPWFRYAAAAIVLIAIGLGVARMTKPASSGGIETAQHEESSPAAVPANPGSTKDILEELVSVAPAENEEARNDAALEASKKTYARLDFPAKKIAREVSGFYFNSFNNTPGTRNISSDPVSPTDQKKTDRYVTLMTPEGNIIRVSKKLGGMLCCISGEADDPACTDQLKKWREKIVASSLGHTADSFMDLLLLVNSAEENLPD